MNKFLDDIAKVNVYPINDEVIIWENTKIKSDLGWTISKTIEETLKNMFDY